MDQELQEADVLWPDVNHRADDHRCHGHDYQPQRRESMQPHYADIARAPRQASSAPVGIPEIKRSPTTEQDSLAPRRCCSEDLDGGVDRAASASFVAPHEMAARRRCGEGDEERSVCVGHGRTLKGRDLRSVRTAVLRMTGFLET